MGSWLMTVQMGLLFLLAVLATPRESHGLMIPGGALAMAGASLLLGAWALMHNRPGNFNLSPIPKVWGVLVTTGPYRWIRHPMYTSVLLGTGALALIAHPFFGWAAWSALAVVLFIKSIFEERWLREQHVHYAAYKRATYRFVPFVL